MSVKHSQNTETALEAYIRSTGPRAVSEVDAIAETRQHIVRRVSDRYEHLHVLWPHRSGSGDFRPGQQHDGVIYHTEHDPGEVVETYFEANPQIESRSDIWAVRLAVAEFVRSNRDLVGPAADAIDRAVYVYLASRHPESIPEQISSTPEAIERSVLDEDTFATVTAG